MAAACGTRSPQNGGGRKPSCLLPTLQSAPPVVLVIPEPRPNLQTTGYGSTRPSKGEGGGVKVRQVPPCHTHWLSHGPKRGVVCVCAAFFGATVTQEGKIWLQTSPKWGVLHTDTPQQCSVAPGDEDQGHPPPPSQVCSHFPEPRSVWVDGHTDRQATALVAPHMWVGITSFSHLKRLVGSSANSAA